MAAVDELDLSRSRHYHALSDPRTCARCSSRCALTTRCEDFLVWLVCHVQRHMAQSTHRGHIICCQSRFCAACTCITGWELHDCFDNICFSANSVGCIKHNRLLRHYLNVRALMWLGSPLEWWYKSDSETEEEPIRHPVLRTLQETASSSKTFTTMCFLCPKSARS